MKTNYTNVLIVVINCAHSLRGNIHLPRVGGHTFWAPLKCLTKSTDERARGKNRNARSPFIFSLSLGKDINAWRHYRYAILWYYCVAMMLLYFTKFIASRRGNTRNAQAEKLHVETRRDHNEAKSQDREIKRWLGAFSLCNQADVRSTCAHINKF